MQRDIFITEDGSHSLRIPEWNVSYHSRHGAIQESMHIYIESGLNVVAATKSDISIFEMGFGTGLNALLTILATENLPVNITYEAAEKFPVDDAVVSTLNYSVALRRGDMQPLFKQLHACSWNVQHFIAGNFNLCKRNEDITDIILNNKYDLVYYDAFDPVAQPSLWTANIFKKMFCSMNTGGVLVTFCSKGIVRRAMEESGFHIEKITGPKGKKEMVRATKLHT